MARTILTTHVLYRGFQSGAAVTIPILAFRQWRSGLQQYSALRSVGNGALIGTVLMVPTLYARMLGREDIEWRDRSWRLLENAGQKEVDDWSLVGAVGGGVAALPQIGREAALRGKVTRVIGGAGLGSLMGVMGYLTWRYGVHGGRFD